MGSQKSKFFYWQRILRREAFENSQNSSLLATVGTQQEPAPATQRVVSFTEIKLPSSTQSTVPVFHSDLVIRKGSLILELSTCNTLNGSSYINKCDKDENKTESIEIPETYISKLLYFDNKLYAFGTTNTENDIMLSYLYVYDDKLNLQEKIDISKCGAEQYKAIEYNGDIFLQV